MAKRQSFEEQCNQLGWQFESISAKQLKNKKWKLKSGIEGRPEEVALEFISNKGGLGCWDEGGSVNILMKSACLDLLEKKNPFQDRTDAIRRFFEAQCTILKDHKDEIVSEIKSTTTAKVKQQAMEICTDSFIKESYPRLNYDFLVNLHRVIGGKFLSQIATIFFKNPYDYRSGWPDITVVENGKVFFVEVKTTDRFHASQLRFAEELAKPLKLMCSIVQVKPMA